MSHVTHVNESFHTHSYICAYIHVCKRLWISRFTDCESVEIPLCTNRLCLWISRFTVANVYESPDSQRGISPLHKPPVPWFVREQVSFRLHRSFLINLTLSRIVVGLVVNFFLIFWCLFLFHIFLDKSHVGYIGRLWRFFFNEMYLSSFIYGVATISRMLKIIGLFCRISSLL